MVLWTIPVVLEYKGGNMKKLMYFLFLFNVIIFSVINYINYSNQICFNILQDKVRIEITKPYDVDCDTFVEEIEDISKRIQSDILMERVENASNFKPHYHFYRTNNQDDFINLHTSKHNSSFVSDTILSTNNDADSVIYGSSLLYYVDIENLLILKNFNLSSNIYYVHIGDVNEWIAELQKINYEVKQFQMSETGFECIPLLNVYQIFLLVFLFVSIIFYMFSKDKEIIIKKIYGYKSSNILFDELKQHMLFYIISFILCQMIILVSSETFFHKSAIFYIEYSIKNILIFLMICFFMLILGCLYIIIQKDISSLKGNSKDKIVYILSIASKVFASVLIIYSLSGILYHTLLLRSSISSLQNNKEKMNNYYTTTMNVANSDIDTNFEKYSESTSKFLDFLSKEYDPIICYSGSYDAAGTPILMVNQKYLDSISVFDSNGKLQKADDTLFSILVPDVFIDEYIQQNHLLEIFEDLTDNRNPKIIRYSDKSNPIYTYNINSGFDTIGYVKNPIIICISNNDFNKLGVSVLSSCNVLFKSDNAPYGKFYPILKELDLDSVITETPEVNDMFESQIMQIKLDLTKYIGETIMYLIIFLSLIFFEIEMYFQTFKKIVAIRFMNGYGILSYETAIICHAVSILIYFVISILVGFNFIITIVVSLLNVIIFSFAIKKMFKNNLVRIIKGEE